MLIGVKLVLICDGWLLICLCDDFDWILWLGYWDLFGGGVELGEIVM